MDFLKQSLSPHVPCVPLQIRNLMTYKLHNMDRIRGRLCDADLDALSKWTWNVTEDQEKMLTDSGKRELRELGLRFRERFPELLDQPFNKEDYLVILSRAETKISAVSSHFDSRSAQRRRPELKSQRWHTVRGRFPAKRSGWRSQLMTMKY